MIAVCNVLIVTGLAVLGWGVYGLVAWTGRGEDR